MSSMKQTIEQLLRQALVSLKHSAVIPADLDVEIKVERAKEENHGDFASNLALMLAKPCRKAPQQLAEMLIANIPPHSAVAKVEIAGPGFINFFLQTNALVDVIGQVLKEGEQFGRTNFGEGQKVLVEFVSANPTGPLHVGHGRSAAFGATLVNILRAVGYKVSSEYYVNDAGRQMNILAVSVWIRYLSFADEAILFPANGYRGDYVAKIAEAVFQQQGLKFVHPWLAVIEDLPLDEPEGGDKEVYIDALIARALLLLGKQGFELFHQQALNFVLNDIKNDLAEFRVQYDCWFSEQSLIKKGAIEQGIAALKKAGYLYEKKGALWFRASDFGDEKDRVLVRANGQATYFASDVAYHWNKYDRGFARVIDIFGADHHGYITRIKAAVNALGHDDKALNVLLVQFAILYRGDKRVQMSTRSGSFVSLRELREEVGTDAARFFYVLRKPEQHMDFDLELAKSESANNPVYYIQYAHARISSVLKQLQERGLTWNETLGLANLHQLIAPQELALISLIQRYPETLKSAAIQCEPHQLAYYLRELANGLHSYYNAVQLLCEQDSLRASRLCLLKAVGQVIRNGLQLLGVSAPESM